MSVVVNRESLKALLRTRYGSLENFAVARGIKAQAVRDLLRNQSRSAAEDVAEEIGIVADQLVITSEEVPLRGVHTNTHSRTHRQNAGAK